MDFSVVVGAFVIGLSHISSFFLLYIQKDIISIITYSPLRDKNSDTPTDIQAAAYFSMYVLHYHVIGIGRGRKIKMHCT